MLTIAALVLVIVVELLRRNFLGQSFGGNVQLCGILFLWMAFIGLIPLYRDSGLMQPGLPCRPHQGPGVRGAVLRQQADSACCWAW